MNLLKPRLGLALSGGGIRAAIFHLGVLQYLAEIGLFGRFVNISSVSGASLLMGAVFAANNNKWPSSYEFINKVQPHVRRIILDNDIQEIALRRLPFSPKYWGNRVGIIASVLEEKWGITGTLQDLPIYPYWEINATTFETGKNFRLRRDYMGDPLIGYVQNPKLPISHMIAASAAFPVLIGPYVLKTEGLTWTKDKKGLVPIEEAVKKCTLWDGGVYDNLGLEALYKTTKNFKRKLDDEINFLIVSNAGAPLGRQVRKGHLSVENLKRLLDISSDHAEIERSRDVYSNVMAVGDGYYIKMGMTIQQIADMLKAPQEKVTSLKKECLTQDETHKVLHYPTTLKSPSVDDFELIFRHGYECIKCVFLLSL